MMFEQDLRNNAVIFRDHFRPYHERMLELIALAEASGIGTTWKDIGRNIDAVLQGGEVIIRENYGRAANKTRIVWNPTDGVVDYFLDQINRRMTCGGFIRKSIHIHVNQSAYFVERIQRTINRKDPQGTAAIYERMTLIDGAWYMSSPLCQSIAASGCDIRGHRLFPFTNFEETWHPVELDESKLARPIHTYLAPDEKFLSNGFEWFIDRKSGMGMGACHLVRVPAWLAKFLPPPATH